MKVLNMFANGGDGELLKSINGTTISNAVLRLSGLPFLNRNF